METKRSSIPQTNRTILFEEINAEKPDLLTLLHESSSVSLNDDQIQEINDHLLVSSFHEFMERFQPVIYGVYDVLEGGMKFTLKRPLVNPGLLKEIPLNQENGFLELILTLMEQRQKKDDSKQIVHFEKMLDLMLPEQVIEQLRQVRIKVLQQFKSYTQIAEDEGTKKQLAQRRVTDILASEFHQYYDVLALLPLAMEDLKRKLFPAASQKRIWNPIVDGVLGMQPRDVRVLDLPRQGELTVSNLTAAEQQELAKLITAQYQKSLSMCGTYVEHLILRSYGLEPDLANPCDANLGGGAERLVQQYNQYLTFYTQSCAALIETAKPVIEKILGIKAFFDQYQTDQKAMPPQLLITNVNNELWIDYQKAERLHTFLNTVNCKIDYQNTLWFAILPNLTFPPDKVKALSRTRFRGNTARHAARTNSMALAANLMNVLAQYQIQTFFSFECDESTTFFYTAKYGIAHYQDGCQDFIGTSYSEYAIPCFPNFTLIPKEKSYLSVGRKVVVTDQRTVEYDSAKQAHCQLWIGGIHLEAAYVAAGLTGAWQCPEYLKARYPKEVTPDTPGVRYDIERGQHWLQTITTMGREITGYPPSLLETVKQRPFGFFFSAENQPAEEMTKGQPLRVSSVTVLSARSLAKKQGRYEATFQVLTANYIERMFRYHTFDHKKTEIIRFFKNYTNSILNQWKAGSKQVNGILQQEDTFSYQLDEPHDSCVLLLSFGEEVRKKEIAFHTDGLEEGGEAVGR